MLISIIPSFPLFSFVNERLLSWNTTRLFLGLFNNFHLKTNLPEDLETTENKKEIDEYIDALLDTSAMKAALQFARHHSLLK